MNWRSGWLLLGVGACGTETGNPELVVLEYNARSTDPDEVALGDGDGTTVEAVWLRLGPVELVSGCGEGEVAAATDALGFADHADPAPAVQELEVEAATVCRLETSFDVAGGAPSGEPEPVAGTSVALTGVLPDARAFEVLVREPVALTLAIPDEPVADASWLLSFDVATWIDADALVALPGDPVTASVDQNVEVWQAVIDRLQSGVQLHEDTDGDGQVDEGERRLDEG
jgi:hypothetical protein